MLFVTVGEEKETAEEVIDQFLLQYKIISRISRERVVAELARRHFKMPKAVAFSCYYKCYF